MKKRLLFIAICISLCISLLPFNARAATQISSVTITNVPTPMAGDKVPVSATVNTPGTQLYSMDWYDKTAGRFLESTDYFIENHIYEVQLWVEAESGYEFRTNGSVPDVTATVVGKTAKVSKAYEYQAWAMVVVSVTFDACAKKEIKSVDIQLDDITKPGNGLRAEEGKYIPFSIKSGDEQVVLYPQLHTRYFPYGFHWSNATKDTVAYQGDRFQGGCDYFVTIALKPRNSEYVFADNFTATIGGKSAQIKSLGKTYVEITVEVTCIGTIAGGGINPVVLLPRDGNAPDYGLYYGSCEHIEYASVTGWYDVESGKRLITSEDQFQAGKQYRVEVTCTAAYGYKFQRDADDKMEYSPMLTGEKVDSYSFGYDSYRGREIIELVKTFTAPIPEHIHTAGNWQCDESSHQKYCTACGDGMGGGAHYGGTATCTQKAKCTVCDYGYGKLEDHKWGSKYHSLDAVGHALQCVNCNGYDTPKPHTPGPSATQTTPQTCTECGYVIEPAKNHTHTPSDWRTTGIYHYKVCTACGDFLEQEDHKGGVATCNEKGKCTVCGYAYLEENEKHDPDTSKWTACGNLYHAHLCRLCGAHCDMADHAEGPTGTPDAAVVCRDCGYIMTPAKDHKHNLSKVEKKAPTCIEPGNLEYYTCDGCSDYFADSEGKTKITDTVIAPSGHTISDDWQFDVNNHWRTCTVCKAVLSETQMAHEMNGEKCATCSYESTPLVTDTGKVPETETEPTDTTPLSTDSQPSDQGNTDSQSQNEGSRGVSGWILLLIGLLAVAVGVVVGVLIFSKKKK